jgi:hypothetical protein
MEEIRGEVYDEPTGIEAHGTSRTVPSMPENGSYVNPTLVYAVYTSNPRTLIGFQVLGQARAG